MSFPKRPVANPAAECRLVVVQDNLHQCPYLDDQVARMPLELPIGPVTGKVTDWLLERGYRRSGNFVYTTQCGGCRECKPTRLRPTEFRWGKSFKRVLARCERELTWTWGKPGADQRRVDLFNAHRDGRNLGRDDHRVTLDSYQAFLTESCCHTMELAFYREGSLIGASIVDVGQRSLSAVYTYFDPAESNYSIGTLAILRQVLWAREHDFDWLYLGMYVAENRHLNYKARFGPQQRLIDGRWVTID
ncbi:MAG: arginyltransferase [Planctomycetota bacterium]